MNNDSVNDIVIGGIDQILPMEKMQSDLLSRIDSLIERSIEEKNPAIASNALKSLNGFSRMSGLASAKFIYTFTFSWEVFPQSKHQTVDSYLQDELGYVRKTQTDYYKVWEMLVSHDIPKEYSDKLRLFPIRMLVDLGRMWSQGWEVESHQWLKLANAPDATTIRKIIREIKGVVAKEGTLNIEWNRDGKSIIGWKNGEPHPMYLQYDDNDPVISAMLERLFGGGKALEK